MGESTLKEKTSRGLFWGGMSSFLQQLLSAAFGIYLARTLSPDDYGMVGMLTIFTMLSMVLQEGGFTSALINRKEIRHEDYNSVFWFSLLISIACYLVLFLCAPLIARFYHHPELVKLSRWNFLGIVLTGFGISHRAYLTKHLRVKEIAMVTITAVAISGSIGVYLAWKGYAYWTLVIQALILTGLTNAGLCAFSGWRPTFHIDFGPVKEMLRYSIKLIVTSILSILSSNLITVILGRFYSAVRVGYYTQANKWNVMGTTSLTGMINSVAQPVLVEAVEDRPRQLNIFRKLIRFTAFVAFPAMLGLGFIAPEFITVALTDKWADSIVLLQILCIGGAFLPISTVCSNLVLSRGHSGQYMWANIILLAVTLGLIYLLFPYGVTSMVVGITVANVLWLAIWLFFLWKELGYTLLKMLKDLLPFLGATALSIAAAWLLTKSVSNIYILLCAKILITAALYALILWVSRAAIFRESIQMLLAMIKKK